MGQRGEIFSTRIFTDEGRKTFFFNVKENRYHDTYMDIVESRKVEGRFKRSSVVVFRDDLSKFLDVLTGAVDSIRRGNDAFDEQFTVGGGRREYRFRPTRSGRPALQLTETRSDGTGMRRGSIIISAVSLDLFLEGLDKAARFLRSQER